MLSLVIILGICAAITRALRTLRALKDFLFFVYLIIGRYKLISSAVNAQLAARTGNRSPLQSNDKQHQSGPHKS